MLTVTHFMTVIMLFIYSISLKQSKKHKIYDGILKYLNPSLSSKLLFQLICIRDRQLDNYIIAGESIHI